MKIPTSLQTAFYLSVSIGLWVLIFMHPKAMLAVFALIMLVAYASARRNKTSNGNQN